MALFILTNEQKLTIFTTNSQVSNWMRAQKKQKIDTKKNLFEKSRSKADKKIFHFYYKYK